MLCPATNACCLCRRVLSRAYSVFPSTGYVDKPSAKLDPAKAASPFSGGVKGKTCVTVCFMLGWRLSTNRTWHTVLSCCCRKFAVAYSSGRVPVRIDHFGSGKNRIQWDTPLARTCHRVLCTTGLGSLWRAVCVCVRSVRCVNSPPHTRLPNVPRLSVAGVSYGELLPICAEGLRETVHPHCFVARQMFKEMVEASVRGTLVPFSSGVVGNWVIRHLSVGSPQPLSFHARSCALSLAQGAAGNVISVLPAVARSVRQAMMDDACFEAGLEATFGSLPAAGKEVA